MHRTLIIRREYLHYIPKYARYEKRHKNLAAHVSPAFRVEEGDQVTVGQCRPLSKTVCLRYMCCSHSWKMDLLTCAGLGPIQRPPSAAADWQGCQEVQQVLNGVNLAFTA
jgi:small subunit ribosomal protein S11e